MLVFDHIDFPEAGIQVPGGSVDVGETPFEAIQREVLEETGIIDLKLVRKLGVVYRDMREFGMNVTHEKHYYQFDWVGEYLESWFHDEETPSDGTPGPIAFRFSGWTSDMCHLWQGDWMKCCQF